MLNSVITPSQHSIPASLAMPPVVSSPVVPVLEIPAIAECGPYRARLAGSEAERLAAFRLRFLVFNLELNEGLDSAYESGYDNDHFDEVCDHLIVEDIRSGEVVGTYRLQSGETAARCFGYYSEQEFDFAPYESMRSRILELGRACVHRDHRTSEVLNLLWKGIMRYAVARGYRYLMGCCSLTSQCAREGYGVFEALQAYRIEPALMTKPTSVYAMPHTEAAAPEDEVFEAPRLLRAYLTVGARICSSPAIDRAFKTIDFLTMIDLETMNPRIARRYL